MTDQEIINKAVAEVRKFQDEVNKIVAERAAKADRFRLLVAEVRKQTGCDPIIAERYVEDIMNPKPRTTNGEIAQAISSLPLG